MQACVRRGFATEGLLPGVLKVPRRAAALKRSLEADEPPGHADPTEWVNAWALAVNEENAAGGQVVTAPTNGAAGIVPAVLHYYANVCRGADQAGVRRFLLVAGAIGAGRGAGWRGSGVTGAGRGSGIGVGIGVGDGADVGDGRGVGGGVAVATGVAVGTGVAVAADVAVGDGVGIAVTVGDEVAVGDGVGVGVAVGVGVGVGVPPTGAREEPSVVSPPPPQAARAKVRSAASERFLMALVGALIAGDGSLGPLARKGTCY